MIVTFYSYKGGVGRTMALANVACQLANKRGMRVLVLDWDLEAPGLHFYFGYRDRDLVEKRGLIDLLYRLNVQGEAEYDLADYLIPPSEAVLERIQFGSVQIMPCGRLTSDYMRRVAEFSWPDFYSRSDAFWKLDSLKQKIRSQFDICLVDARAGQSEINITPTSHVPDAVALIFTSNEQSISGTDEVARRIFNARAELGLSSISQILVPSRVFPRQPGYADWFNHIVQPIYDRLVSSGILGTYQPNALSKAVLAVDPSASFGEALPILDMLQANSPLVEGYIALAEQIVQLSNSEDLLWRPDRLRSYGAISESRVLDIRNELQEAAKRGDENGAAFARLKLARYLREFGRLEEAQTLALASLTYSRSRRDKSSLEALAQHELGQLAYAQRRYGDAIGLYTQALKALDLKQDIPRGIILHDLGVAHAAAGRFDQALHMLEQALKIKRSLGDLRGEAMSVHQLGNIEFSRRNTVAAAEHFQRAADLALQVNDTTGVAISYHQLGNLKAMENPREALDYFRRALVIHAGNSNQRGQAITRRRIADLLSAIKERDLAYSEYMGALSLAYQAGDRRNALTIHRRLGDVLRNMKKYGESRSEFAAALGLARELGLGRERFLIYLSLARTALDANDFVAAQSAIALAGTELGNNPSDRDQERFENTKMELATKQKMNLLKAKS